MTKVDGSCRQGIDDSGDLGGSLIGLLKLHEIGGFLVNGHTGNTADLVLQLLHHGLRALEF